MNQKAVSLLLFILILPSLAAADIIISKPKIAQVPTGKIEVGASPEISLQYKNTTGRTVYLTEADIFLDYDPSLIDAIIGLVNNKSDYLLVKGADLDTPGKINYRLKVSSQNPNPLKVGNNRIIDLATIIFHVNQRAAVKRSVRLFDWSEGRSNSVRDQDQVDVTGLVIDPEMTYLEESAPPQFTGLSQVASANMLGETNPGNTLVLDWRTPAGAFDLTRFYDNKLSYRVFRKSQDTDWQEISEAQPAPDPYTDPIERYPYKGNTNTEYLFEDKGLNDGQSYLYKVTAIDDTSPQPNEQTNTAVLRGVPLDLTPPQEVSNLSASVGNNLITLKWTNPKDPDLGGVVIMVNEDKPISNGFLGQASTTKDGPEYKPGDEPFGQGNGQIIYVSPQANNFAAVPEEFADTYAANGLQTNYKIFTYDLAMPGPPREFGRNYSRGVAISETAGIAPRPITNFKAEVGEYPGEILLMWNNSLDDFAGGTLVRFTNNDRLKFAILKNERSGDLLADFPAYGGPGDLDGYFVSGFEPEKTYYFSAFAHNATEQELDPKDPASMALHHFSSGQIASVYLPKIEAEETEAGIRPATPQNEPEPELEIQFGKRIYRQALVDKGLEFFVTEQPEIKMAVSISKPFSLDQTASSYYMIRDKAVTHTFKKKNIEKDKASFAFSLPDPLTPGK
ncbi:MAG: hypothetical protein KJ732_02880, partial [Candidatus Margulisbacteria bacterium]|nr:hypothetical protein [Candidatus Margulisiibacteriota bacterium]